MRKALLTYERQKGLYQSKVTSSLTFTHRQGHQAHNCKMSYSLDVFVVKIFSLLELLGSLDKELGKSR